MPLSLQGVKYYIASEGLAGQLAYGFTRLSTHGDSAIYRNGSLCRWVSSTTGPSPSHTGTPSTRSRSSRRCLRVRSSSRPKAWECLRRHPRHASSTCPTPSLRRARSSRWPRGPHRGDRAQSSRHPPRPPVPGAELYVELDGLSYEPPRKQSTPDGVLARVRSYVRALVDTPAEPTEQLRIAYGAKGKPGKAASWRPPASAYYWGVDRQLVNLGYQPEGTTRLVDHADQPGHLRVHEPEGPSGPARGLRRSGCVHCSGPACQTW